MIKYNIYIGLNDKEKLKQIIDTSKARKEVYNILLKNNIKGYTIYLVNGVFTNEKNEITKEKTLKVEVLDIKKDDILRSIKELKKVLNQESILLEEEVKKINFI
jgi:hypothetical protein